MTSAPTRVLVLGATGMLGHTLFERLARRPELDVHATVRGLAPFEGWVEPARRPAIRSGVDAARFDSIERAVDEVRPAVLINAIGIVKQVPAGDDPIVSTEINAVLPHQLARLCAAAGVRLVHFSTDCVFAGTSGNYREEDEPDPVDAYGRSKLLGEPGDGALTLRTSFIGHELTTRHGLLEWMLARTGSAVGYRRAIFSGLTTVEMARVLAEIVIPRPDLSGVHHVSSAPIAKIDLFELVARRYALPIEIVASDEPRVNRSLDSSRFQAATGYRPPSWPELVDAMHRDALDRYGARFRASPAAR